MTIRMEVRTNFPSTGQALEEWELTEKWPLDYCQAYQTLMAMKGYRTSVPVVRFIYVTGNWNEFRLVEMPDDGYDRCQTILDDVNSRCPSRAICVVRGLSGNPWSGVHCGFHANVVIQHYEHQGGCEVVPIDGER